VLVTYQILLPQCPAPPNYLSELPDRGDVEPRPHLLADQDTGRGVPVHALVLAVDRDAACEADPEVAPNGSLSVPVSSRSTVTGLVTADGQVTGDHEVGLAGLLHLGRGKGDGRVIRDVEEVAAQVLVAPLVAGLDALRLDRELGAGPQRVVAVQVRAALDIAELPAHLGGHRAPGDEADPRVGGVEEVVAGQLAELGDGKQQRPVLLLHRADLIR
jgi:hypothetical protein